MDFLAYRRLSRLWSTTTVPNVFHSIGKTPKLIPEKKWGQKKILSRRILICNVVTALSKLLQKWHYPSKIRTILKQNLDHNWYSSQVFANRRKSRETSDSCTNQGSLSPREVINDSVGCPEPFYNCFGLRYGSAWDTLWRAPSVSSFYTLIY